MERVEEDKNQDEITKDEEAQEFEKLEEVTEEMEKQVKQEDEISEEVQISADLNNNEEEKQDLTQPDGEEGVESESGEEASNESKQEIAEIDETRNENVTNLEAESEEIGKPEADEEKKIEQEEKEEESKEEKSILGISYLNVTAINNRRNKIIIIAIIAAVVVVAAIISGIVFVNINKNKEEKHVPIEQPVIEEKRPLVPVYSEEAKQRMQNIYEWNEGEEKVAYLTFDDGPSNNITPQILDILREQEVKATFFVLGSRVELYPELLKQEYDEGHYIANHGYSHNYSSVYETAQSVVDEYYRTESLIVSALNLPEYCSHLFRFPGGSQGGKYANIKNEAKGLLEQNDVQYINWNALTSDAVGTPTPESIMNDLISTTERKKQSSNINA